MPAASLGTEQAGVGSLTGKPSNCGHTNTESALFQIEAVPQYNRLVQGQARLRTVPADKLFYSAVVVTL